MEKRGNAVADDHNILGYWLPREMEKKGNGNSQEIKNLHAVWLPRENTKEKQFGLWFMNFRMEMEKRKQQKHS